MADSKKTPTKKGTDDLTELMKEEGLEVGGYLFKCKEDAEKARIDERKIDYLKTHAKMNNLLNLQTVYTKSIQNKIFGTPLGWGFLALLRNQIELQGGDLSALPAIEMTEVYHPEQKQEEKIPVKKEEKEPQKGAKNYKLLYSILLNLILIVVIVGMFVIASSSTSTTVLNYREALLNEYSSWETELEEREATVEAKEKELGIETQSSHAAENSGNAVSSQGRT